MKRLIALLLLLSMLPLAAFAAEAADISKESSFKIANAVSNLSRLTDKSEGSPFQVKEKKEHLLYVTPGETPIGAIELVFGSDHQGIEVQREVNGEWITVAENKCEQMTRVFLQLEENIAEPFRIRFAFASGAEKKLNIREIYLYSEGEQPEDKHIWQEPFEKADMLVLVAHPDDEILWFGGTIPYYTKERGMAVQVGYLTCENSTRRGELLDGLGLCGVRHYPEIQLFPDEYALSASKIYGVWGENKLLRTVVRIIRKYKPEVIVTHDKKGEYGHGAHKACSEMVDRAVSKAADPKYDADSIALYGTWEVKKAYVHLGAAPTLTMDWTQPMASFDGKTGLEVAAEAFECHASQTKKGRYAVAGPGDKCDSSLYTLIHTTVGEDVIGGDFFENIP